VLISIDGPSGVGKTTITKRLADILGLKAVSTGAIYRAVAYAIKKEGVSLEDVEALRRFVEGLKIDQEYKNGEIRTYLNGEDVSGHLDEPEISDLASKIAAIREVREALLEVQRRIAGDDAVVEGRDIGSVVLPYADIKIYLDASLEVRVKRRYEYLRSKGLNVSLEEVKREVRERDNRDKGRSSAPLIRPKDAFYIDTTHLSVDEVVNRILKIVRSLAV
jgi:cytidylate kinase